MSNTEIHKNSEALIIAGSETTATCLSGTIYYLGRNAPIMQRLVDEVRSNFNSEDEITIKSTLNLTYLQAVIEESLRIFPPVVVSPTRVSPGDFVGDYYIPKNVSSTNHITLMAKLTSKNRPRSIFTSTPPTTVLATGIVPMNSALSGSCRRTTHFTMHHLRRITRSHSTRFLMVQQTALAKI